MARFDRFDIVEAWYVWLQLHHCGIVSDKIVEMPDGTTKQVPNRDDPNWWFSYNRLSFLPSKLQFRARPNLRVETLEENAFEIYQALCDRLAKQDGSDSCADDGLVLITENGEQLEVTMPQAIYLRERGIIYFCPEDGQFHINVDKSFDDVDKALEEYG